MSEIKNKLALIGLLLFSACATTRPKGGLTLSANLTHIPECPKDRKVIYETVVADIDWEVGSVSLKSSWQCTKIGTYDDTYRVHKPLADYVSIKKEKTK